MLLSDGFEEFGLGSKKCIQGSFLGVGDRSGIFGAPAGAGNFAIQGLTTHGGKLTRR
jgi:hypothetical protein